MELEKVEHLKKIETSAKDLIKFYCPSYVFVWDRSLRRKGQCRYGAQQIGISKPLAELNSFECMLLTVIHEIAHALAKGHDHDETWKALCIQLGGDGERYYSVNNTQKPKAWILYKDGIATSVRRYRRFKTLETNRYKLEWRREL